MESCEMKKFVCKYCNKRYPCGKSLGGHLRSHNVVNLIDDDEKAKQTEDGYRKIKIGAEVGGQEQSGYVDNEKLKKTWMFSDSSTCKQLKICKECGKEFQSVKALCGHMACHSEKEKQKEIMYGGSDSELSGPMQQRRSRRLKCRTLDVHSSSVSMANGSSSTSKIELEQEEVAMCLLMLSSDIGNWDGVNSNVELSDNNSAKSTGDTNFTIENGLSCASKISELVKKNKPRDNKSVDSRMDLSDDSDSDYFENGVDKTEWGVSDSVFLRNYQIDVARVKKGPDLKDFSAQWRKNSTELGTTESSLVKSYIDNECEKDYKASNTYGTTKGGKDDFGRLGVMESYFKKMKTGNSFGAKVHRDRPDGYYDPLNKSIKNTVGTNCALKSPGSKLINSGVRKSRKSKGHKCPFCPKIFRSGQALGGHKRIHFLASSKDRTLVIKQEFDLNFPPPELEETNGNSSFMPWKDITNVDKVIFS